MDELRLNSAAICMLVAMDILVAMHMLVALLSPSTGSCIVTLTSQTVTLVAPALLCLDLCRPTLFANTSTTVKEQHNVKRLVTT